MPSDNKIKRFIYPTQGVCPPEIHFKINSGRIEDIRFVGGGCPGNAQLVTRLLEGKPIEDVLQCLVGIDCRNGTSCPDQLASALHEANQGRLHPAESFRVHVDTSHNYRIALVGGIEGNAEILENLIQNVRDSNIETAYLFGNLTGNSHQNKDIIKAHPQIWYYCCPGRTRLALCPRARKKKGCLLWGERKGIGCSSYLSF